MATAETSSALLTAEPIISRKPWSVQLGELDSNRGYRPPANHTAFVTRVRFVGIRFRCHHCEHELNLKNFQAGRRARCPVCSGRFRVPTTSCDFSAPLEDDEQELASTSLRAADQPGADRGQVSPTFELKQPTSDLERFKRPAAEANRASAAGPNSAKATSAQSSRVAAAPAPAEPPGKQPDASKEPATPRVAANAAAAEKRPDIGPGKGPVETAAADSMPTDSVPADSAPAQSAAAQATSAVRSPDIPRAIAEAPQAVWYVRPPSGGQFGPADSATFYQWMKENRVAREALVWRDGWPQWMIAAEAFEEYYGSRWLLAEAPAPAGGQPEMPSGPSGTGIVGGVGAGVSSANVVDRSGGAGVVDSLGISGTAGATGATGTTGVAEPARTLIRRKRRKTNYALGIIVLAIVAIALVAVLIVVLMSQ